MKAAHFYCPHCAGIQPVALVSLLPGERSLGTTVQCARCAYVAFTLIRAARIYCRICDDIQPALLKSAAGTEAKTLVCGACLDAKATLYGAAAATP